MGEFGECGRMGGWKVAWRVKGWDPEGVWIVRCGVWGVGWGGVRWSDLRWGANDWKGCRLQAEGGCRGCLTVQVRILLPPPLAFFALHPLNSPPYPLLPPRPGHPPLPSPPACSAGCSRRGRQSSTPASGVPAPPTAMTPPTSTCLHGAFPA